MKLKNVVVIVMLLLISIISLPQVAIAFGPATILKSIELLGKLIPDDDSEKNGLEDFKISKEIDEQHAFGDNIVFVHEATNKKDKHGHIFIAYNKKEKKIMGWLFCSDEKDTYPKFQKMNLLEKKLFLCENFRQYAKVDLSPISPRSGDTYETVIAEFGKPDDRIPLYYEEGIAVSEMLIYYESPKKFLAVGITRGKVVKTQEFALQEGQGLKDALASAGITPAAAPEPTPAPRPTTRKFGPIPTTSFMP